MTPIFKRKKKRRKSPVDFHEFKKGEVFSLSCQCHPKADIIAVWLPRNRRRVVKADAQTLPGRVGGEYRREGRGNWTLFVINERFGLLPYGIWKKKAAQVLSTATKNHVSPDHINIADVPSPESLPIRTCSNCQKTYRAPLGRFCPFCGKPFAKDNS